METLPAVARQAAMLSDELTDDALNSPQQEPWFSLEMSQTTHQPQSSGLPSSSSVL